MTESKERTLYCVGNSLLEGDCLALEVGRKLKVVGWKVRLCTAPDQLLYGEHETLYILDVVRGIEKVEVIDDFSKVRLSKITTLHDFDLGHVLEILLELGRTKKVVIIGIPEGKEVEGGLVDDVGEKLREVT